MELSTWAAFFTPGMDTEIWSFPEVLTWAPDTPRPFTRLFRMATVSASSVAGTLWLVL